MTLTDCQWASSLSNTGNKVFTFKLNTGLEKLVRYNQSVQKSIQMVVDCSGQFKVFLAKVEYISIVSLAGYVGRLCMVVSITIIRICDF